MTRAERFEKCFQDWLAAEAAGLKYDFEAERKRERIASQEDHEKLMALEIAKRNFDWAMDEFNRCRNRSLDAIVGDFVENAFFQARDEGYGLHVQELTRELAAKMGADIVIDPKVENALQHLDQSGAPKNV